MTTLVVLCTNSDCAAAGSINVEATVSIDLCDCSPEYCRKVPQSSPFQNNRCADSIQNVFGAKRVKCSCFVKIPVSGLLSAIVILVACHANTPLMKSPKSQYSCQNDNR